MEDLVSLSEDRLCECLGAYSDSEIVQEYEAIQGVFQVIDSTYPQSMVYEFLDKYEPLIVREIVCRFSDYSFGLKNLCYSNK